MICLGSTWNRSSGLSSRRKFEAFEVFEALEAAASGRNADPAASLRLEYMRKADQSGKLQNEKPNASRLRCGNSSSILIAIGETIASTH